MRLCCYFCGKSVSTEVSGDTIVRAVLVCPECIEAERMVVTHPAEKAVLHAELQDVDARLEEG